MKNILLFCICCTLISCSEKKDKNTMNDIRLQDKANFDRIVDGKEVSLYTLESGNGLTMQVTNFGARVVSFFVPDRNGKSEDIVLGYNNIDDYLNNKGERFLGAVVGRYANRIANGKFTLNEQEYRLSTFNNGQCLHGGDKGFDRVVWNVDSVTSNSLYLSYVSPDGEEGFPGKLSVKMHYVLTPQNEFKVIYEAVTDKPTVVNLSHHSFFNLKGEGNGTILDHLLQINASYTTPVDSVLIPTGEVVRVENTPFDFGVPTAIGAGIGEENEQLKNGSGYDHNWVIDRKTENETEYVASLYEPESGRFMEIFSDQPALQFYSGNFFDGTTKGKYGRPLRFRESVALETQKYPDSPNHPNFPSTVLNPGEIYRQTCIYKFSVK